MLGTADEELAEGLGGAEQAQQARGGLRVPQGAVDAGLALGEAHPEQQGAVRVGGVAEPLHEGGDVGPLELRGGEQRLDAAGVGDPRLREGAAVRGVGGRRVGQGGHGRRLRGRRGSAAARTA